MKLPMIGLLGLLTLGLVACAGASPNPDRGVDRGTDDGPGDPDNGPLGGECTADRDGSVVQLSTEDGLTLEADFYVEGASGGPVLALFHMIPPSNDRSNYGPEPIEAFLDAGFSVLNVDRRGAGGSEGNARDAYEGPNGLLDVAAAVSFLSAHACAFDMARLGLVGASNGTTSVLDYTVAADTDEARQSPAAIVFLTGGGYTENQNRIINRRAALDELPIQFVYSTAERAWSVGFEEGAAEPWQFNEYADGAHGTRMFGAVPGSVGDVAAFLSAQLGGG